ncbi:MAG: hypothetical protein CL840_13635 [Crocinitomicaceae bacterium]|nr:hypothetical protein [Crocinitomicaceae bacterium]|tara:strand:- start:5475 stop:6203 length:729 start_codon:yes stop_codon:yes gene_type:complete
MKNSSFLFVFSLSLLLVTAFSCNTIAGVKGSSNIIESNYEIADFDGLQVSHAISVKLVQAEEYKVVISHNDNLKEYLVVKKSGSTLVIGLKSGRSYRNTEIEAVVYTPVIKSIDISGASEVKSESIKSESLTIETSGASSFKADLNCKKVNMNLSGASSIILSGESTDFYCEASGASDIRAKNLTVTSNLNVRASGASNISVLCNGNIEAKLSGASNLYYYGSGVITNQSVTGASNIKSREL